MNKILKLIIVLTLWFSNNSEIIGQSEIGVQLNSGTTFFENPNSSKMRNSIAGELGFYFKKNISQKLFIGGQLNFNLTVDRDEESAVSNLQFANGFIAGPDVFEYDPINVSSRTDFDSDFKATMGYLNLPLFIGADLKKLRLEFGFQGGINIVDRTKTVTTTTINNETNTIVKKEKGERINKFDYGPRMGVGYLLTNRLRVNGFYYHGLNDIRQGKRSEKIRAIGLGCSFKLK